MKKLLQRIKQIGRNWSLTVKISVAYAMFVIVFGIVVVCGLWVSFNVYDEKLYDNSLLELNFFTEKVDGNLEQVERFSALVAMDSDIQERLSTMMEESSYSQEYAYQAYMLRALLIDQLNEMDCVKNITYTDQVKTNMEVGTATGELDSEKYNGLLNAFSKAKGGYVYLDPSEEYPYMLSGRNIRKRIDSSLDYLGSLILVTDVSGILDNLRDSLTAEHSMLYVYHDNYLIYPESTDMTDLDTLEGKQGYDIVRYKGQQYFRCYISSQHTGWTYVNMYPYSDIYGRVEMVRAGMVMVYIFLILASIPIIRFASHTITAPLEHLKQSMQIVETGDFSNAGYIVPDQTSDDEVMSLVKEFNIMLDQINILIHENYEKQILLEQTKYKMLQAQINPHFLYNTLNSISWMIKLGQTEDASKMIIELGILLRASFAKEPYGTVEEEINMVKSYIAIQRYRYKKRAEFILESSGDLGEYMIPRMILQPLVENGINYGIDESLDYGRIEVHITEEEDDICLEVINSGPGMSESDLEQARQFIIQPKGHGIGLKNIKERLNIAFEAHEFRIESDVEEGTRILIRVPKRRKGEM